jgi:hypothetical protein
MSAKMQIMDYYNFNTTMTAMDETICNIPQSPPFFKFLLLQKCFAR